MWPHSATPQTHMLEQGGKPILSMNYVNNSSTFTLLKISLQNF